MAGTHHQACSHPGMSRDTRNSFTGLSIGDRETLRSPDLTFRWDQECLGGGEKG